MAITQSVLTSSFSTTDTNSYSTASISPTANKLILAFVSARRSGATPGDPSLSGASMTWTQIVSRASTAGNGKIAVFRALSAAPGSGAVTILWPESEQNCTWAIVEVSGIDTSGTNGAGAIVQSGSQPGSDGTTSITVTLSAISDANNATFGGIQKLNNSGLGGVTSGAGFAEIVDIDINAGSGTADDRTMGVEWQIGTDNTVDWTFDNSNDISAVAVEVKIAPSVGGETNYSYFM